MRALHAPMWIAPSRPPARWWLWKAHIDTGSPVTIAGSRLARRLLEQHVRHMGRPPPYERLLSATGHPLTVAPVDAVVRAALSMPMSAQSEPPPRPAASHAIDMRVCAGIEAESATDEAGGRAITLKNWGDCDVLVGMDLLSQFKLTIEHGTIRFDLPTGR